MQQTKPTYVGPPSHPCGGSVGGYQSAQSGYTTLDVTLGTALNVANELPKLAGALRLAGGAFSVGGFIHGVSTGNYGEAALGLLDTAAFIASAFPPADFVTGPYFAARLGVTIVQVATDTTGSNSTCVH